MPLPRLRAEWAGALLAALLTVACRAEEPKKADPKKADAKAQPKHADGNHDPRNPDGTFKYTNRLSKETSPYLQQHAHNPVDWHPWGDEAFALAKKLDKPVFLSIGYSTCHWCHVMERESFANEAVAKLLNEKFVCIKVDREERPDVDAVYMKAVQTITGGGGGWPLTAFLTPDRKPFFGLTYLPPEDSEGRTGLKSLLKIVHDDYWKDKEKRVELEKNGEKVIEAMRRDAVKNIVGGKIDAETARKGVEHFEKVFDPEQGGFRHNARAAPKFPRTHVYNWLMRQHVRNPKTKALDITTKSLDAMAGGGIYDHLGGGFHRYSTDREWLTPHFEKMLYDQALITHTYVEAYQLTGDAEYARVVRETFEYVLRDLTHPGGGFYSAEDADSEGVEGKFYVWTDKEIDALLGADAALFKSYYGVTDKPNFEEAHGTILHAADPLKVFAFKRNKPEAQIGATLAAGREKLLAVRSKRIRPHRDDKVLAGWNGLMIGAMAFGGSVLGEAKYVAAAERAADFVLKNLRRADGRLLVAWRDGKADKPAYLDDYAHLAGGLIDLYEATGDPARLRQATGLADEMIRLFADEADGGFHFSGRDGEKLVAASKEIYDGAMPSGNSAAALTLLRLAKLTGNPAYSKHAESIFSTFGSEMSSEPWAYPHMMTAWDFRTGPTQEIVLAGDPADKVLAEMHRTVRAKYLPNKVVIARPPNGPAADALVAMIPWVKDQPPLKGRATAYVCENRSCKLPVHTAAELEKNLAPRQ